MLWSLGLVVRHWGQEVNCAACGEPIALGKKFCGECGAPADGVVLGNVASTGGGDVHGGLYQAGRDVVVNSGPSEPASASYEAVPRWRSPFTLAVLSWIGLLVGLIGLLPLWKLVQPILEVLGPKENGGQDGSASIGWVAAFCILALILVLVLDLRRIARSQLRQPLIFGWALSGQGGRITLEKVHAGRCPKCGGTMRYFNKPTEWINHLEASGRKWREVTERVPALECRRNPKHWFEVDAAEDEES